MKPILLQGSERSSTQIKYNGERDLLFSVSKDPQESEARTKVSARGSDLIFRNPCRKTTHTLNSTNQSSRPFQPLRPVPKHLHLQHTLQEKKVLTSLQRDIIIQPADKGRCAVILNTSDCFEILFGLLNTKYSLGSMF